VPRKPKTPVENKPADDASATSADGDATAPEPKKKSRAAASSARKKKPAAKKPAPEQPAASAPQSSAGRIVEPSDDEIRLRAYFLAERRHKLSLPGDSAHDWIEARRQLIEETSR
jgi:hypothetical protein